MAFKFKRIITRDDAIALVRAYSAIFFAFAAMQIAVAFWMISIGREVLRYMPLPADAVLNYVGTAAIIATLAALLRRYNSRVAAVLLLLVSAAIAATTFANRGAHLTSGNPYLALVGVWCAARAIEATFKIHGHLAQAGASYPATPASAARVFVPEWLASKKATAIVAITSIAAVAAYIGWDTRQIWQPAFFSSDYDAFVRSVQDSCTNNESKHPLPNVNKTRVDVFCTCYAAALAKELTAQELDSALKERGQGSDISPALREKVTNAAPACRQLAFGG